MSIRLLSLLSSGLRGGLCVAGDDDVGTGTLTGMSSDWSSQGEEALSVMSSLLMVGITMVRPSSRTMLSLTTPTLLKDTVMSSPLRTAQLVTGMSPLLRYRRVPLDMFTSSVDILWVVVESPKLLVVAAAASRYHRGVCARVVGSFLESVATVVIGTPVLDGIVEEKSSVVTPGLRDEPRK